MCGLSHWDAVYFLRIAQAGYEFEQFHAFFPLLPLLIRILSRTGRLSLSISLCLSLHCSPCVALWSVWLFAFVLSPQSSLRYYSFSLWRLCISSAEFSSRIPPSSSPLCSSTGKLSCLPSLLLTRRQAYSCALPPAVPRASLRHSLLPHARERVYVRGLL